MNAKLLIIVLVAMLACAVASAQTTESTDSLTRQLQEVVVTARQPATRLVGTTLVSTIAGSNLADLGTALDVLAQLPMIQVHDNTVSVTGRSNIKIYIDGRPMRDDIELQQLLSSNIRRVELLMAPGAAYDSTTGAVLRITTRRDFAPGLSVTDQFNLQRRRRWSVMDYLSLSYHTGAWEFFADGTVNNDNRLAKGSTTNTLMYDGRETVVGGSQHNSYTTTVGVVKAGFNYAAGSQSFGAYYRYNPERGDFTNTGTEWLDSEPALDRLIDRSIRSHSHLASAYYDNTFADRYHLHFDGDYRQSTARNGVVTSYLGTSTPDVLSTDRRTSSLWAGKLYLDFPLWQGDFTVGTQDSYTHTSLDYRMLNDRVGEYIPSSLSDARQTSAALFATWARMFGRFNMSIGARYEYVDYDFKVDGRRDDDISRRDHLLTPDLTLGYTFSDDAQLSLSYKMSTVKPPYSQLTGALNYVGRHEIEGGNAALRDERMHDIQLFGLWNGFILQADYVRSLDTYAYVKQLYPARDLQLLMHPVNIDVSALSVYLVWNKPVGCWTPNVTVGVYRQWLTLDNCRHDRPIFSYYFDNTFALPRGWMVTANVSGSTRGDMHTNRFGATWFTIDASIGRTFFNKSLNVKLSATDIFNTANNNWTMDTYGVHVDKRQSYDRRGIALTVIYKFRPRKSRYKGTSAAEAEMNRL
ncbi:MAG: outer membrane beta-barrel family protein [Muribaculaceae bacterium]|nr:outer membrane beta-barrel family protein [Muribaculaceae bacterium]